MTTFFASYATADDTHRATLGKHLKPLVRLGKIALRSRDDLPMGGDRDAFREQEMASADVILLLLTNEYLSDDEAFAEYELALQLKAMAGKVLVPINVTPNKVWEASELAKLQPVRGGKPITAAPNADQAWYEVVTDLEKLLSKMPAKQSLQPEVLIPPILPVKPTGLRTIHIFLASANDLEDQRKAFEAFIHRENSQWIKQGVFVELKTWQDALQSIHATRLQDRFNDMAANSDIFVSLFHKEARPQTIEEFEAALASFQGKGKPLVYTYFYDGMVNTGTLDPKTLLPLLEFKERLAAMGHQPTAYANEQDLELKFLRQLRLVMNQG